jgi:O-antigen ligase
MRPSRRLAEATARFREAERFDARSGVAFLMLLLLVAAGPWVNGGPPERLREAFGGGATPVFGYTLLCLAAFLIAALTFLSGSQISSLRPLAVPLGAAAGLAGLGAVQLLPLPEGILGAIAPVNLTIYHETAEILRLFGRTEAPAPRISIAPAETVDALLVLAGSVLLFVAAASLLSTRLRRRVFLFVLFAAALLQIVVGALHRASAVRLRGAFANPDHFAAYVEIALAAAFGLLWAEVLTNRERAGDAVETASRFEKRVPPVAARVLLWGLLAAGLVLTESRGGLLAAGCATIAILTLALTHRLSRGRRRAASTVAAALLLGAAFAGAAAGASRFSRFLELDPRDTETSTRVLLWKTSWAAWREFPIVGSGLGTFREAFRRAQPADLPGLVEHAHDDLLQLAVTGGAAGALLGFALVASLAAALLSAWRRQRHREESALALAGFGALLSLTLHGFLDFHFSIPIIPATLACLLGASWAAATRS